MSGFTPGVVELIWERDNGCCALCGLPISGTRGFDWSVHHRMPRSSGGTRRTWINMASNGVLLHGNGTQSCHSTVESNRTQALQDGFLISANGKERPHNIPIQHAVHGGRVLLNDDGTLEKGVHVF